MQPLRIKDDAVVVVTAMPSPPPVAPDDDEASREMGVMSEYNMETCSDASLALNLILVVSSDKEKKKEMQAEWQVMGEDD